MAFVANQKRRNFLRQVTGAFAAGGSFAALGQLGMMRQAIAGGPSNGDYRALVCIYLAGGNDSYNLFVPTDNERYGRYASLRDNLAIPLGQLLPVTPLGGGSFGFHPSCMGLQTLFEDGDLAVLTNIGTLVAPMTKVQFDNGSVPRPPQLFSHNSQTDLWQVGSAIEGVPQGWGGLVADQVIALNTNPDFPMSISVGGDNLFGVGAGARPYQIGNQGLIDLNGFDSQAFSAQRQAAFNELFSASYDHPFERGYRDTMAQSVEFEQFLTAAFESNPLVACFPDTGLGNQLATVANFIASREAVGQTRQIFYVQLGGFDTHNSQLVDQPQLLSELSGGIEAFQAAMLELDVVDCVTSFTMSDFARTLSSNGDGSDHAWGGQQIVIGGAVSGREVYGTYPELELDGADAVGRGRMIPSTAVDQLGATLARWMGVQENEIAAIFPNLNEFASADIGFLA